VIFDLLAALRALPKLVEAVERLGDIGTAIAAQERRENKDKMVADLIIAARERRLRKREAERVSGDSGEESGGDGASDSNA
jgi:hypothetical protein